MNPLLPFSPDRMVQRSPEQVSGDIDGQVVMLNIENGEYYKLNQVGSRIWTLLERPIRVATIVETLMAEFEIDHPTCERETIAFLAQLQGNHLLRIES